MLPVLWCPGGRPAPRARSSFPKRLWYPQGPWLPRRIQQSTAFCTGGRPLVVEEARETGLLRHVLLHRIDWGLGGTCTHVKMKMTEAGLGKAVVGRWTVSEIVEGAGSVWPEKKRWEHKKGVEYERRDRHWCYIFKRYPIKTKIERHPCDTR